MKSELLRFVRGFGFAAKGILLAVREERNFRFHLCAAAYVLFFAVRFYDFSPAEWAALWLCIVGVPALELINSAVERAVNGPDKAHWAAAGAAKDLAAGGVLFFALGTVCVGICLFWRPIILAGAILWFLAAWYRLALLTVSLLAAFWFVFGGFWADFKQH